MPVVEGVGVETVQDAEVDLVLVEKVEIPVELRLLEPLDDGRDSDVLDGLKLVPELVALVEVVVQPVVE